MLFIALIGNNPGNHALIADGCQNHYGVVGAMRVIRTRLEQVMRDHTAMMVDEKKQKTHIQCLVNAVNDKLT